MKAVHSFSEGTSVIYIDLFYKSCVRERSLYIQQADGEDSSHLIPVMLLGELVSLCDVRVLNAEEVGGGGLTFQHLDGDFIVFHQLRIDPLVRLIQDIWSDSRMAFGLVR